MWNLARSIFLNPLLQTATRMWPYYTINSPQRLHQHFLHWELSKLNMHIGCRGWDWIHGLDHYHGAISHPLGTSFWDQFCNILRKSQSHQILYWSLSLKMLLSCLITVGIKQWVTSSPLLSVEKKRGGT